MTRGEHEAARIVLDAVERAAAMLPAGSEHRAIYEGDALLYRALLRLPTTGDDGDRRDDDRGALAGAHPLAA